MYEDEKSNENHQVLDHSFDNNSSKFYRECSACDNGDVPSRAQKWIEQKFKDTDSEQTHLFIEQKFDNVFNDCSFLFEPKIGSNGSTKEGGASSCQFSREDLNGSSLSHTDGNFSVYTDKGSESKEVKEPGPSQINKMKVSNFWKRVDMRQKKVIRGLSGLSKDFFKGITDSKSPKESIFQAWDDKLRKTFPELYQEWRLKLLGHISVMCLSWKFADKIRASSLFTADEKDAIIKFGEEFKVQRTNCSNSSTRKLMLNSPLVQIGKLLYKSSQTCEESFWNQILERKKSEIVDFKIFKETHLKDFHKISDVSYSGSL